VCVSIQGSACTDSVEQFTFPDLPESTKVGYLNAQEKKLALDRLPPKRSDGHNIEIRSLLRRVFMSPTMYAVVQRTRNELLTLIATSSLRFR
jgi:hypothetical protein